MPEGAIPIAVDSIPEATKIPATCEACELGDERSAIFILPTYSSSQPPRKTIVFSPDASPQPTDKTSTISLPHASSQPTVTAPIALSLHASSQPVAKIPQLNLQWKEPLTSATTAEIARRISETDSNIFYAFNNIVFPNISGLRSFSGKVTALRTIGDKIPKINNNSVNISFLLSPNNFNLNINGFISILSTINKKLNIHLPNAKICIFGAPIPSNNNLFSENEINKASLLNETFKKYKFADNIFYIPSITLEYAAKFCLTDNSLTALESFITNHLN